MTAAYDHPHVPKLDRIDRRILAVMQTDGRVSNLELAEQIGLSPTPCSRRVKRLEESGLIDRHLPAIVRVEQMSSPAH